MSFQHHPMIHVYYDCHDNIYSPGRLLMGRLALNQRKIFFEYNSEFIKTGLELSPFKLPLKTGLTVCEDPLFDGLFGVFNDSLPDGWGRLLLDRALMKKNINPHQLSPLDKLCYVGSHGMGALTYEPEIGDHPIIHHHDLDEIAHQTMQFQINDDAIFLDELLALNGSSAGARPKILINLNGEDWIIKFRSSTDPKEIALIEYAYHLMAKKALLNLPEAKLFQSKTGAGYFGVKRFDRQNNQHIHMHTMSGLLHIDHRVPSLDYEIILKATAWLTKDIKESEKQFRAAVFNVLSHNRDDHAKNFSFLMDKLGTWQVSPAYDLTFSSGPSGEHCTLVMGEGKNPTLNHLLKLAEIGGIKKQNAIQVIEEVRCAVAQWEVFAKDVGLNNSSLKMIQNSLNINS